jgi:hypothetical protein
MHTYTVTCRVENCPNKDLPIEVIKEADGNVICGPCKTEITDIAAV